MKKVLIIALLFSVSYGFAQNLSLNELISLRTMNLDDVEVLLNEKGWEYTKNWIPKEDLNATLEFTNKVATSNFESPAYIHRYFSSDYDQISLFIFSQSKYLEYVKAIKASKAKLIYSKNIDGLFFKVYQSANTTFILRTYTALNLNKESKPAWKFSVWSTATFEKSPLNKLFKE